MDRIVEHMPIIDGESEPMAGSSFDNVFFVSLKVVAVLMLIALLLGFLGRVISLLSN